MAFSLYEKLPLFLTKESRIFPTLNKIHGNVINKTTILWDILFNNILEFLWHTDYYLYNQCTKYRLTHKETKISVLAMQFDSLFYHFQSRLDKSYRKLLQLQQK